MANRLVRVSVGVLLGFSLGVHTAWAFSASYDQRITKGTQVIPGKVVIKDQMFRMEATVEEQETVTIRNSEGIYTYLPSENMAMKINTLVPSQQPVQHAENYLAYLQERQAQRTGTETVDGHPCEVYRFTDPTAGGDVTAWVWTEKQFPLKMEVVGREGKTVVELSNVQIGQPVSDVVFQLPSGAQVMDMGAMLHGQQQ